MLEGDIWPNGKAFCWYSQIATKADCTNTGLTPEEFEENFFSVPNPVTRLGDTPYAGCSPMMVGLTTSSQVDEKTSEYIRRILCIKIPIACHLQHRLHVIAKCRLHGQHIISYCTDQRTADIGVIHLSHIAAKDQI